MIKLMIAEDEALERKAINFLINKYFNEEVCVVSQVINGRQAVEEADKYKPDIILMDINMPILDGLEASSIIKERKNETEIIIITAFNNFEYAKRSISIGVGEYLLKPVSSNDFIDTLSKTINKIKDYNYKNKYVNDLKKSIDSMMPLLEKEMILDIIYGNPWDENKFLDYKKLLNIHCENYLCIIFKLDKDGYFNNTIINIIKFELKNVFEEVIGQVWMDKLICLLFFNNPLDSKIVKKCMESIEKKIILNYKIKLYKGISSSYNCYSDLFNSYKEAKINMESSSVLYNENKHASKEKKIYELENIICSKIINEDLSGGISTFNKIISYSNMDFTKNEYTNKKLYQVCYSINKTLINFFGDNFESYNMQMLEESIKNIKDKDACNVFIDTFISDLICFASKYREDSNTKLVEKVKKYINENYSEDITLNSMAEYVSLSPYYLSRIFNKIEGINFKDYIIKVRMENSKKMLREANLSIKEIANKVGYIDQNYFSKAFKRYTGRTPKEYINL